MKLTRGFGRPVQAHTITREEVEHLTEEVSTVVADVVELYVDPDTLLKIKTKLTALVEQAKAWAGEA